MELHKWALVPAAVAVGCALLAAPPVADAGKRWWSHVEILASDAMEGRETGSAGHRKAAEYVAAEFERAGLRPAGTSGYIQPVAFDVRKLIEPESGLELVRDGKAIKLTLGDDAVIGLRTPPAEHVEAALFFAGYGFTVPEMQYDDLAGEDLRGKIIVTIQGAPSRIPGPLRAHYLSVAERRRFLERAGVVGVVTIPNPKHMDIPWDRAKLARFTPSMSLADPALNETGKVKLAVQVNPASAVAWFDGSGHAFAEMLAPADEGKPLPRFPLRGRLRSHARVMNSRVESQNVAGVLPGADPRLKDEYVVLTAHLDHVGVGKEIEGDRIYNGAMDNASGVATLLEIARMMREAKAAPRRSVLFVAVTGEEKGLLGSRYFAAHPTVPAGAMVANINFDMFLPIVPLRALTVYGLNESDLGGILREVAKPMEIAIEDDPEPQRNLFIRSDQYSFIRRGVPALAMKVSLRKGTPEEKIGREWLRKRYHAPSDDLKQPVNLETAAQFNRLMWKLVEAVSNCDERPRWNNESFFKRFAAADN